MVKATMEGEEGEVKLKKQKTTVKKKARKSSRSAGKSEESKLKK